MVFGIGVAPSHAGGPSRFAVFRFERRWASGSDRSSVYLMRRRRCSVQRTVRKIGSSAICGERKQTTRIHINHRKHPQRMEPV